MSDHPRCDVCSAFSKPGSPINYGCTLLDGDGTYTALCLDCTQTFLPLDAAARRAKWPLHPTLLAKVHALHTANADNDPVMRDLMRCIAVNHNTVCTADARVVCDVATVQTAPSEVVTYEEGLRRADAHLRATGQIAGAGPAARMVYQADTGRAEWQDAHKPLPVCAACGHSPAAPTSTTPLVFMPACGRCRSVHYCDVACQKAHWRTHRASCVAPPPPAK